MKHFADKRRTERSFEVGDWVYLRLQPYRQKSVAMRHNMKLAPRFYGPFCILQKIGTVAYKLQLPPTSSIHPVFHVSSLKKKLGQSINPLPTLPLTNSSGHLQPEPQEILYRRLRQQGNRAVTEVLVRWVGTSEADDSWEVLWKLHQIYPHLIGTIL